MNKVKESITVICGKCGHVYIVKSDPTVLVNFICARCQSNEVLFDCNVELDCLKCNKKYSVKKNERVVLSHLKRCPNKVFIIRKSKDETI